MMLGTPVDNVVVRIYAGPGPLRPIERRQRRRRRRGRSSCRRPSAGRCACSGCAPTTCSGPRSRRPRSPTSASAWDAQGTVTGYQADHYMPAMQDDRLVGAVIAGLPTPPAPGVSEAIRSARRPTSIQDPWLYGRVPNVAESGLRHVPGRTEGVAARRSACATTACARRDSCSRTSRASSRSAKRPRCAGIDAIEFRLKQTDDARLIGALKAVREASGWETRPSPRPQRDAPRARRRSSGQGVSVMLRSGTYWACVCQVTRRARHRQGHRGQVHDRRGSRASSSTRCS